MPGTVVEGCFSLLIKMQNQHPSIHSSYYPLVPSLGDRDWSLSQLTLNEC